MGGGPRAEPARGSHFMSWRLRLSHGQGRPGAHRLVPKEIVGRCPATQQMPADCLGEPAAAWVGFQGPSPQGSTFL